LNSEWCIDAARFGNNTRFINHADSAADGLNCEAKILLVNGEHRIKFIALRDIAAGEELLFNYGKKFAEMHGLSAKLPKSNDRAKQGVVVGKEALDALDGMGESQGMRGRMTAIRGGHRSGRGGKRAIKSALLTSHNDILKVSQQAIGSEDVEMKDVLGVPYDDDDVPMGGVGDGLGKRKTQMPKKYTR
jgi:hypothetical protein